MNKCFLIKNVLGVLEIIKMKNEHIITGEHMSISNWCYFF